MAELPAAGDTVAIHIVDVALDVELDGTDGTVVDAVPDFARRLTEESGDDVPLPPTDPSLEWTNSGTASKANPLTTAAGGNAEAHSGNTDAAEGVAAASTAADPTNTKLAIPPFSGPTSTTESKGTVCDAADNGKAPGARGAAGDDDSFDESGLLPPVQPSLGFRTATAPPTMGAQSRTSSGAEDGGGESKGAEATTEGEVAAAAAMPPPAPLLLRSASDRPPPTEVDPSVKQVVREAKQRFRVGGIGVPRNQFTRFITKNRPLPALRLRMLASIGVRKADEVRSGAGWGLLRLRRVFHILG